MSVPVPKSVATKTVFSSFQEIRLIDLQSFSIFGGDYSLANYERLLSSSGFFAALRNTLAYSVFGTAGAIGFV